MARVIDIRVTSSFQFEELLSTNRGVRLAFENAVRSIMWDARETASERVKKYMFDSAHDAHLAIRNIVYRRVIGGELNILNVRRALRRGSVAPSWRGRTPDTTRILSYHGVDRGFVFRFVNDGTNNRWTTNMNGKPMKRKSVDERPEWHNKSRGEKFKFPNELGGRGGAAAIRKSTIGMFKREGEPVMAEAAMELQKLIDRIIDQKIK